MSTDRTNQIEQIASDWLVRRESGDWTEVDQARFQQWLEESVPNRVAFLRLELAWEESARLKALGAGVPGDRPPPPGHWNLTPFFDPHQAALAKPDSSGPRAAARSRFAMLRFAAAATVVLALAVGFGAQRFWNSGDRYATPVGGLASVPMPDGSKVTLNTDSSIRVAVDATRRRIDLERGEAFFEVAKDPGRPFVVRVAGRRVVAVGTKFSVRREDESVEVVVTEGKVRVEGVPPAENAAAGSAAPAGPALLMPGAIAHVDATGMLVQHQSLTEAETRLSWRAGMLMFRERSLGEAVAEFNRYNVRKIIIADPAVAALKVEGNFKASNTEAFVRLLESGFQVRASIQSDVIVLNSR